VEAGTVWAAAWQFVSGRLVRLLIRWCGFIPSQQTPLAKDERDPVSPREYVLRRVFAAADHFNPALSEPVQRVAFQPNKKDAAGISVFRELFVTPMEVARRGPKGPSEYIVVRLLAADVFALGLSVLPDPQADQPPGHAIIPELTPQTEKKRSKELQRELAKLGGRNIAYRATLSGVQGQPG